MNSQVDPRLRIDKSTLVRADGSKIRLRGLGLGGYLNLENWINGFPATERAIKEALGNEIGVELTEYLLDELRRAFFSDADAAYLRDLGMNAVRVPFHYGLFESDDEPFVLNSRGFEILDRLLDICARHGIYTILDLHTAPGWQNQDWHCDNPSHLTQFWTHSHFQDRVVWLWELIAEHYRDNPWIVGFNLLNEPADPSGVRVAPFYQRIVAAVRDVDPDRIILLDGNRHGLDFQMFDELPPNVIFSPHDYPPPGHTPHARYPGSHVPMHVMAPEMGTDPTEHLRDKIKYWDKVSVEANFMESAAAALEHGMPLVVGEFNAIFPGDPELDAMRLELLRDQLEVFDKYDAHWIYWGYKDVGVAAPLTLGADTPWMTRLAAVLEKKKLFATDHWGGDPGRIAGVLDPIRNAIAEHAPHWNPFPWGPEYMIKRVVAQILLSEALVPEFAAAFRGADKDDLNDLAGSFALAECQPRTALIDLLSEACSR